MSIFSYIFLYLLLYFLKICFDKCEDKREKVVFILAWVLKVCGAVGVGFLYSSYYSGGDTFNYLHDLELLEQNASTGFLFKDQPRAWYFVTWVYLLYLLSSSNYWVLAAVLSTISFIGTWAFYQELKQLQIKRWTIQFALFFIPSVVFWTSGLMKETVSFTIINLVFYFLLCVRRKASDFGIHLFGALIFTLVLYYLKYYLFAPLLLVVILFLVIHFTKNKLSRKQLFWSLTIVVVCVPLVISVLHPNMNFNFFLEALHNNYSRTLKYSSANAIIPISYDGSFLSFLINIPNALFIGLFRPLLLEGWDILSFLLGVENLLVFCLFVLALRNVIKTPKFNYKTLFLLSVFFIVFLAVVLPIASPNYGSLVRYRTAYYPLFVLIILQGVDWTKKGFVQSDNT